MTFNAPRWLADLQRLLTIRSQFIVSGHIRDTFLTSLPSGPALSPLVRTVWETLRMHDYQFLLLYDPADGLRVYPNEPLQREWAERLFDLKLPNAESIDTGQPISLESLSKLLRNLVSQRTAHGALLLDFASRLTRQPNHLSEAEHRFFVAAEKLAVHAAPVVATRSKPTATPSMAQRPRFNPVLWLVNRPQDLPSWFALDNERIATLVIGKPDYETRQTAAAQLAPLLIGYDQASMTERAQFLKNFTEGTEGMSLTALSDITELADLRKLGIHDIDDAVRCYKVGAHDNPWRKDYLRSKIRHAQTLIEDRVKGQYSAVVKTLDILKRSVMGLTGAQARSGSGRPRGVLFFAGPTGVGKTELAKTLTQLIFGDERAYLRFDMSEFAEEHTSARLLGAPPGYIGFDAGGELTNAVREKPFSVVLFDEIEKAHPRILDKFLQILEDGRLTDGRGETAYFSETILIFTSNLGIYVEDASGQRRQNVRPGDAYDNVEAQVREAIENYFKFKLARPELLNRIGDNIVVFDFITPDVAEKIFHGMLKNVARRLQEEFKIHMTLAPEVLRTLLERCTHDLDHGGRGIGNQLESAFINPLSRILFETDLQGKQHLLVNGLQESEKVVTLTVQAT